MISWAAGVPGSVWLISQTSKAIDTALKLLSYLESLADIYGVSQQEILFRESESWNELVLTYSTLLSAQIALPGLIMAVYLIVKRYKSRNLPNNTNCGTTSRGMNPGIELGF